MIKFKQALTFDDINIVPEYSYINSRSHCKLNTQFTRHYDMSIPIISSPMDTITGIVMAKRMAALGGVGVVHRFCSIDEQVKMCNWNVLDESTIKCAAVGIINDYFERAVALVDVGVNVLLLDVAHGHHLKVAKAISKLKVGLPGNIDIIAGCVATAAGAEFLCNLGIDAVRVGVGNGSLCVTRIKTGVGIPQVTALQDTIEVCNTFDVPVIADGGMKSPGDVAKALALGAKSCVFGSLFSGTKETPGVIHKEGSWPNELLIKRYRGSASRDFKIDNNMEDKNVEGHSTSVPYKGKVCRIINNILDGVRSSMSYVGVDNLVDFAENATFVQITEAGKIEANPHLLRSL